MSEQIPIDPSTGRPIRGKGSRGARGSKPKSEMRGGRGASAGGGRGKASEASGTESSFRGRGASLPEGSRGRGRGRGRGQGRGRGGSLSILSRDVLVTIPEPFAAPPVPVVTNPPPEPEQALSPTADDTLELAEPVEEDPSGKQKDEERVMDFEDYEELENEIIIHPKSEEEREAMSPERLQRFEIFRRSKLPKPAIKKVLMAIFGSTVPASTIIAVAGSGKMFIGEIVEKDERLELPRVRWSKCSTLPGFNIEDICNEKLMSSPLEGIMKHKSWVQEDIVLPALSTYTLGYHPCLSPAYPVTEADRLELSSPPRLRMKRNRMMKRYGKNQIFGQHYVERGNWSKPLDENDFSPFLQEKQAHVESPDDMMPKLHLQKLELQVNYFDMPKHYNLQKSANILQSDVGFQRNDVVADHGFNLRDYIGIDDKMTPKYFEQYLEREESLRKKPTESLNDTLQLLQAKKLPMEIMDLSQIGMTLFDRIRPNPEKGENAIRFATLNVYSFKRKRLPPLPDRPKPFFENCNPWKPGIFDLVYNFLGFQKVPITEYAMALSWNPSLRLQSGKTKKLEGFDLEEARNIYFPLDPIVDPNPTAFTNFMRSIHGRYDVE
ncbi:transcription initiation factor TFIID subunit 11 [Phlyctochytrium planicorne]|nr:transcription initiation factor TFIID subunit 11 [Phlyctochytrium planicorne]